MLCAHFTSRHGCINSLYQASVENHALANFGSVHSSSVICTKALHCASTHRIVAVEHSRTGRGEIVSNSTAAVGTSGQRHGRSCISRAHKQVPWRHARQCCAQLLVTNTLPDHDNTLPDQHVANNVELYRRLAKEESPYLLQHAHNPVSETCAPCACVWQNCRHDMH